LLVVAALLTTTVAYTAPGVEVAPVDLPGHFRVIAFTPGGAQPNDSATFSVKLSRADGTAIYTRTVRSTRPSGITIPALDFSLDVSKLPPGMYSIVVSIPTGAFQMPDGTQLGKTDSEPEQFSVSELQQLPSEPKVGQHYLYFPWADEYSTYNGPDKAATLEPPLSVDQPHELVLTAIERRAGALELVLRESKAGQVVRVSITPAEWLPLKPIANDAMVDDLRSAYEGKHVWHYAGGWSECPWSEKGNGTGDGIDRPQVRITRIARIYGGSYIVPLGSMPAASMSPFTQPGGFYTWSPIVVFFDRAPVAPCIAPYFTMFSDRWDFERVFSLAPPAKPVRDIALGMTKDEVAWSIGFPLVYGTRADVFALDTWKYAYLPPFHYWVYFKDGKVVKFGQDGNP
jgi:hypothetical protein